MCEVRKTTDDSKSEGTNSVLKAPVTGVSKRSGGIEGRAVVEQGDKKGLEAGDGQRGSTHGSTMQQLGKFAL